MQVVPLSMSAFTLTVPVGLPFSRTCHNNMRERVVLRLVQVRGTVASGRSAVALDAGWEKRRLGIESAKLQDILHNGGVSTRGLARLLKRLSDADDVPVEVFRKRLLLASKEEFRKHEWKVQLQLADGEPWTWSLLDPRNHALHVIRKIKRFASSLC